MPIKNDKRVMLLGSYLDCLTMNETMDQIQSIIQKGKTVQHVVINASKINLMHQDEKLRTIVNHSDLINADGQSIVWAGRFLGFDVPERVTGIDLFVNLVDLASSKGYKVYYFGAEEKVVQKVVKIHQKKYPDLKIAGFRNGFFTDEDEQEIVNDIKNSGADILFVAFSSPQKEFWINKYKDTLNVPFVMGVGGSFDVIAGKNQRAPEWMQKLGLEWFFRFIQEPRRLFKRYIVGNISFMMKVFKEKFLKKENSN